LFVIVNLGKDINFLVISLFSLISKGVAKYTINTNNNIKIN